MQVPYQTFLLYYPTLTSLDLKYGRVFYGFWMVSLPPRHKARMTLVSLANLTGSSGAYIRSKTTWAVFTLYSFMRLVLAFLLYFNSSAHLWDYFLAFLTHLWEQKNRSRPWTNSEALSPGREAPIFPGLFPRLLLPSYVMDCEFLLL